MSYTGALLAITGPTASGKTRKAVAAALRLDGEVISADSRQVYRGMDLGTGKDLAEYHPEGCRDVQYHLIDIRPAGYKYNLQEFLADYDQAERGIRDRGRVPVLCGGTGMYVEYALSGVRMPSIPEDPDLRKRLKEKSLDELASILGGMKRLHNTTDTDTRERAIRGIEIEEYYLRHPEQDRLRDRRNVHPVEHVLIALDLDRDERRARISARLRRRLAEGMTAEVESLLDRGVSADDLIYYGLEYKFVTRYVTGQIGRADMERGLETAIHQFAKRQMTWLRGMERRGFTIHWLPAVMPDDDFAAQAAELLNQKNEQLCRIG